MMQCHGTCDIKEGIMRSLGTSLTAISLFVFALLAQTTTNTPLDCYQFGSFEEAQAAYEADQASFSPTLTYLDDDGDGLICECLYYEEICWLPSSEPPTPSVPLPTDTSATGPVTPLERLDELREERRE
jgi:hypothetical protein